jgi:hypothetical protein
VLLEVLHRLAGPAGADAVEQLQQPHPAQLVGRVLQHAQEGEQVLDVRRLQEA